MNNKVLQLLALLIIIGSLIAQVFYLRPPFAFFQPMEPYPAILLPAGEQLFKNKGKITYQKYELEAVSDHGKSEKIDISNFLDTVPPRYAQKILNRKFGIPTHISEPKTKELTDGRSWIGEKITSISTLSSARYILLKSYQVTLTISGNHKSTKLSDIETIYLSQD